MPSAIRYVDARCTLGLSLTECVTNLRNPPRAPAPCSFPDLLDPVTLPYFALPSDTAVTRDNDRDFIYQQLRAMVAKALATAALSTGERSRTGLFVGSSSFDVGASEQSYQQQLQQTPETAVPLSLIGYGKLAQRLQREFALSPHIYTYSTACTSSANAALYAHRMLEAGVIDHALVIGLELFNQMTALGFHGLGLISPAAAMMPFSRGRDGLILGEGCGLILLSRSDGETAAMQICGGAIATDNHSLTAANVDGSSLAAVIAQALSDSGIDAESIVAIKAHGTASLMNDEAEAAGLRRAFAATLPPIFALKPFCGHTLGASGALEMALTIGCMEQGFLPLSPQPEPDPELQISLINHLQPAPHGHYLFNCFAFGGNNNALILRAGAPACKDSL